MQKSFPLFFDLIFRSSSLFLLIPVTLDRTDHLVSVAPVRKILLHGCAQHCPVVVGHDHRRIKCLLLMHLCINITAQRVSRLKRVILERRYNIACLNKHLLPDFTEYNPVQKFLSGRLLLLCRPCPSSMTCFDGDA